MVNRFYSIEHIVVENKNDAPLFVPQYRLCKDPRNETDKSGTYLVPDMPSVGMVVMVNARERTGKKGGAREDRYVAEVIETGRDKNNEDYADLKVIYAPEPTTATGSRRPVKSVERIVGLDVLGGFTVWRKCLAIDKKSKLGYSELKIDVGDSVFDDLGD